MSRDSHKENCHGPVDVWDQRLRDRSRGTKACHRARRRRDIAGRDSVTLTEGIATESRLLPVDTSRRLKILSEMSSSVPLKSTNNEVSPVRRVMSSSGARDLSS